MSDADFQPLLAATASDEWEYLEIAGGLAMILMIVLTAALVVGYVGSRIATFRAARRSQREAAERGEGSYGFPVVTEAAASDGEAEAGRQAPVPVQQVGRGPGRYRIVGVVAATGTDIRMYVDAETPANAKVKAELKGVIVTEVEKQ